MNKKLIIEGILALSCVFAAFALRANCSACANPTLCPYWLFMKKNGNWALVSVTSRVQDTVDKTLTTTVNSKDVREIDTKGNPYTCPKCNHSAFSHNMTKSGMPVGFLMEE
jgi:hypothetical protein